MSGSNTLLDFLTAIGSIATPLLVLALTGFGWRMRAKWERIFQLEDKLREDRIATYNQILEPFIILLMTDAAWQSNPKNKNKPKDSLAVAKLLSLEYRQQGFKLSLVGSDAVVQAYNDLMQYFYTRADATKVSESDVKDMMSLLGNVLLEIRRSMGNEATKLDRWSMLEWFINDARKMRDA